MSLFVRLVLTAGAVALLASFCPAQDRRGRGEIPENFNTINVRVRPAYGSDIRVLIRVNLFKGDAPLAEEYANGMGEVRFSRLEDGPYLVYISAPGYEPESREMTLFGGRSANLTFLLMAKPPDTEYIPPENDQVVSAKWLAAPDAARSAVLRARELRRNRDMDGAVRSAEKALAEVNNFPFALHELGLCHWQMGKPDEAAGFFQRAIDADPEFLPAYLNLASIKSAGKDFNAAAKVLAAAAKVHPTRSEPFLVMGQIQYDTGHIDKAEQAAQMALQRDTSAIPQIHVLLANVYLNKGELDKALKEMDTYLEKAPKGPHVQAVKDKRNEVLKKQKKEKK